MLFTSSDFVTFILHLEGTLMSKMQIRFIATLIIITSVPILSACDYNFALSPKQGLPLDNALIGSWRKQSGEQVNVSKNGNEYSIVQFSETGVKVRSYTGYPIKIGGQLLVQAQIVGASAKPYLVFSYYVNGSQLTLRSVKYEAKTQAELMNAIIANKPNLFRESGEFTKLNTALTPNSFTARGLNNERLLANIYLGNFNEIPFKRDNSGFGILYTAYLNSYAQQCAAYLPSNKVEMTAQECATERVTRNGWGVEISRTCVEWRSVGTGLYADPKMYEAKLLLDRFQTVHGLRLLFDVFKNPEKALGDSLGMVGNAIDARSDTYNLIRMNTCSSPGLKRFQENLNLFALNRQPIVLTPLVPISNFTESEFPLPPLITGNWETLDKRVSQNLLVQLVNNAPADWKGVARRITKLRVKRLLFYPGATLCEGLVPAADSNKDATITFIAFQNGKVTLLNGTSSPIHELNKKVPLAIDTKERAEDYLRFFFSSVYGDDGSFRIVEGEQNISWAQNATTADSQKVVNHLQPLLTTKLKDRRWKGTATVQYGNAIFNVVIYAKPTGEVEMADDTPIAIDLPLRREKYEGYLRREKD